MKIITDYFGHGYRVIANPDTLDAAVLATFKMVPGIFTIEEARYEAEKFAFLTGKRLERDNDKEGEV